ncbi:PREDICTED: probable xyloglucan galactosyltransferase GT14 [Tarenaya hassleriana]|uniref:probable xyloglucan galactosyltransferase GT14 n=1 Tax=Tarenaya hassleriana TaxID=28532 RepID=UPI00053C8642|nr:PREDICTED: probable xyloglucan galactosyltransferase GT14 [Tarenaya hassleriana]
MENPIGFTGKFCRSNSSNHSNVWFVVLVSFVLCSVLLCFDYSSLSVTDTDVAGFAISDTTQNSVSRDFSGDGNFSRFYDDPVSDSCFGRYVYVHDLPRRFNHDLLENCSLITRGTEKNMCPYLDNLGFGPEVENSENVLLNRSWFVTNQFMLEVIFHNKMKKYSCLTNNSSLASAIFVPFYAGLDMSRFLWGFNTSARDSSAYELMNWLVNQKEWNRMSGRDHFLVAGRISWDFRRQSDNESDWGSKLRFLSESQNMSMLSVEASSWNNDYAIPYPTCFHPASVDDIVQWQERIRARKRKYLFSFAGAPRPEYKDSIRGKIIDQCLENNDRCFLLDCNYGKVNCDNPVNVMRVLMNSVFCLQPPGDSYTRRSVFDSIIAGCIPVFFHPGTAYAQYKWHLPKDFKKYSIYLPVKDVSEWRIQINETLLGIPEDQVTSLRGEVTRLIPRVVYADPKYKLDGNEGEEEGDAFDLAVKGMIERIEQVRKVMKEGKDPGDGFADADDYKFTFPPYEKSEILI